jgi:hypothetical protein
MTEVVAAPAVERVRMWRRCRPEVQRLGPPPSLPSTATVLAATRGEGVDRMPPEGQTFRTNALENEGRGLGRRGEGSAAPDVPEGELGSPSRLTAYRRNARRNRRSRRRSLVRDYSVGLSFMR